MSACVQFHFHFSTEMFVSLDMSQFYLKVPFLS